MDHVKSEAELVANAGIDRALEHGGKAAIVDEVMHMEALFIAWVDDQSATAATLAERVGMPVKDVRRVLRSGVMQQRYLEEVEGFAAIARPYTQARVHEMVDMMLDRMKGIIESGEDRDAISATRVLAGMIEKAPEQVSQVNNHTDTRVLAIVGEGLNSLDQVQRLVGASISGNIQEVEAGRARKG